MDGRLWNGHANDMTEGRKGDLPPLLRLPALTSGPGARMQDGRTFCANIVALCGVQGSMSKKNNYFDLPTGLDDAELLEIFHEQNRPLRLDALLRVTGLPRAARKILEDQLYALADEGRLVRLQGGLWARADGLHTVSRRHVLAHTHARCRQLPTPAWWKCPYI